MRQVRNRAGRLAAKDKRPFEVRLAEALTALADVIEEERDPARRMPAWLDALAYLKNRVRQDFTRTTGERL